MALTANFQKIDPLYSATGTGAGSQNSATSVNTSTGAGTPSQSAPQPAPQSQQIEPVPAPAPTSAPAPTGASVQNTAAASPELTDGFKALDVGGTIDTVNLVRLFHFAPDDAKQKIVDGFIKLTPEAQEHLRTNLSTNTAKQQERTGTGPAANTYAENYLNDPLNDWSNYPYQDSGGGAQQPGGGGAGGGGGNPPNPAPNPNPNPNPGGGGGGGYSPNPNPGGGGIDWGGYQPYVPGSNNNGYQPQGDDPNFQGHTGTDIPQALATPGYAAGPGHTYSGQNMPGESSVNISESGLMQNGQHNAITREVQDDETVAGQLEGLLSSENPLVKQARLRAEQDAASRGLNNSSMALQSGEQAAFSSMMPVAQQDAATYANQGLTNQQYENEFAGRDQAADLEAGLLGRKGKIDAELNKQSGEIDSSLTAQQGNINAGLQDDAYRYDSSLQDQQFREQSNLSYQDYAEEAELNKKAYENQFELNDKQYGFEYALQELKNQTLIDTAAIEAENKVLIQTNAGAAQIYSQYMESVSILYESVAARGASAAQLSAGLADLQRGLKENMDVLSSFVSLDLSEFGGQQGGDTGNNGEPPGWPAGQPWPPTGFTP